MNDEEKYSCNKFHVRSCNCALMHYNVPQTIYCKKGDLKLKCDHCFICDEMSEEKNLLVTQSYCFNIYLWETFFFK